MRVFVVFSLIHDHHHVHPVPGGQEAGHPGGFVHLHGHGPLVGTQQGGDPRKGPLGSQFVFQDEVAGQD